MDKKIAFLFGAGVSIPAKIPKTETITNKIFTGEGIVRGTAEDYFFDNPEKFFWDPYQGYIPRIISFLKLLENELQNYYRKSTEPITYEDLYYLLDFIRKNIFGSEINPSFRYLLKNFEANLVEFLSPLDPLNNSKIALEDFLDETIKYIEFSVILSLSKKAESYKGLSLLNEVIQEQSFNKIDIYTLNHDKVIEEYLLYEKIAFCEGFGRDEDGFRFWDISLFEAQNRIALYKLHGSVDWYYFDERSWTDRRICKCSPDVLWRENRKPILLIGTYNKLASYIKSIYLELFYKFYTTLTSHNVIIVSGYSFGDKGINEKLFDWVLTGNNKMIIIDPYVDNLKNKLWTVLLSEWEKENKIIPIKGNIEDVTLSRISKYL